MEREEGRSKRKEIPFKVMLNGGEMSNRVMVVILCMKHNEKEVNLSSSSSSRTSANRYVLLKLSLINFPEGDKVPSVPLLLLQYGLQ